MIPGLSQRRQFRDLSEQEVLALAISSEEDDASIYRWYAQRLRDDYPQSARIFDEMAGEEDGHRSRLIEEHRRRFGDTIPLIRREHVAGFYHRRPVWLIENLGLERIRDEAARMEVEARDFYLHAAQRTSDAGTRQLLGQLAAVNPAISRPGRTCCASTFRRARARPRTPRRIASSCSPGRSRDWPD